MNNYLKKVLKQETYLGENKKNYYFEGWYFKLVTNDKKTTIAIIPGITKGKDEHAFIQVIDNIKHKSYYFRYPVENFSYTTAPFSIKIENNLFSLEKIHLDIKDIKLKGTLEFKELLPIKKNIYSPNIMGPFAYLTSMECNHSVISLGHRVSGKLQIYNKKVNFTNGISYIEKDYGTSFPTRYIWLQASGNQPTTNFFLSIAKIPFNFLRFDGIIGIVMVEGKEYRFATYHKAKVIELTSVDATTYSIKIKQGNLVLEVEVTSGKEISLVSPKKGRMQDQVKESLDSTIKVRLHKKEQIIIEETFYPCTTEILW